jgi:hypothetical protein
VYGDAVTAAIFGLVGVVVGAIIASAGQYFIDRRGNWNAARAAGLVLYSILDRSEKMVKADPASMANEALAEAWAANREALLFRRGNFPSGLSVAQWLALGDHFAQLELLARDSSTRPQLLKEVAAAKAILEGFTYDDFTLPTLVQNSLRNIWRFSTRGRRRVRITGGGQFR